MSEDTIVPFHPVVASLVRERGISRSEAARWFATMLDTLDRSPEAVPPAEVDAALRAMVTRHPTAYLSYCERVRPTA